MNVSVIITVLNEADSIEALLTSLANQTELPDEVVVVDGGSSDGTVEGLARASARHPKLKLRYAVKKGNRSLGRNTAITMALHDWLAITDAGCTPHPTWLAELKKAVPKTKDPQMVIAGYYDAHPRNAFEAAVVPYVLVMPDCVNPETFLPATRSMLLHRQIWHKVGGFDETLSDNEDYAFAHALLTAKAKIIFAPRAKVTWHVIPTLRLFAKTLFRYARGDIKAGILRPKVGLLFGRYVMGLVLLASLMILGQSLLALGFIVLTLGFYSTWAIIKNYRYVSQGWYWLPVLQLVADGAVMGGSVSGFLQLGKK